MKTLLAFIRKEFYHILRDRRTLLILFGMPIAQVLIFGYAITNEFKGAGIAIVDQSHDDLSIGLSRHLLASDNFRLVRELHSIAQIHPAFQTGKIKMAVVIPPDFGEKYRSEHQSEVQLITDGTDPNTANTLVNYATIMISQFNASQQSATGMPATLQIASRMVYNPELKSVYMFVPGVITLVLMLISALMTSLTLAREKELGTMELLLVSPLHPLLIIVGKVLPYVLLSLMNAVIILALGVYVFHVPILGNFWMLLAFCLLFVITALALGILISTRTKTQQTAMMASLISLMMPTMLLSGFIFPIESMPIPLQVISNVIPAKYFIVVLKSIMLKGNGLWYIWREALILSGMTLFFLMVSWKNFKLRLE